MLTEEMLRAMARGKPNAANMNSVLIALDGYGQNVGLSKPHRLAHFLAQLLHESASFRYDRELWGPTAAQKRYEGRKDLGNVQKGDGSRYRGRGPIQLTGRANYRAFTKWARMVDADAPNFEKEPDRINTDPWEGLSAIWYWDQGNPTGKSLNRYADDNNIEMVTRRINGGLNGYSDRLDYYTRVALVLLGYGPDDVERFQREHPDAGAADGISGVKTRMALHRAIKGTNPFHEIETIEREVEKPVVSAKVEHKAKSGTNALSGLLGGGGTVVAAGSAALGADWETILAVGGLAALGIVGVVLFRKQIIAAIRDVREA